MIPVGAKVKIDLCKKRQDHVHHCIRGDSGFLGKFNAEENTHIKSGTISEGMSKETVLMAYGYPPSRRRPDLKSGTRTYWDGRFAGFLVIFQNNGLTPIEQGIGRTEEKGKKK